MGTNYYGSMRPYEMYSERWYSVYKRRKSLYTPQDLAEIRKLLRDFGVQKTDMDPPASVKTYGQLHRWKWMLICEVLDGKDERNAYVSG